MEKYLVVWPKSESVVHINYHYTQFGESVDYLKKFFHEKIIALDCDIDNKNITEFIEENNVSKVIMQVNYENAKNAFEMCNQIKEKSNIPVLGYGNIAIRLPKIFLNSKFDLIYKDGDPEVCMRSFLENYQQNEDTSNMQEKIIGANLIRNGSFLPTQKGQYIHPDNWGISRKEDVPIDKYDEIKGKNRYIINISRGCPYGCSHCLIQLTEGRRERRRSIENLSEAIDEISSKYNHVKLWAANFTLDKQYVKSFCEIMSKHPDMTWECATRIDLVRDKKMLEKMYESGCRQISLGVESLNNGELIKTKDFRADEISKAISDIQSTNIKVKACIMFGMPNQSKESIIDTLSFLKDRQVAVRPTIYTPYQTIPEDVKIEELSKYNRKTYENNNVKGVTSKQLEELVKRPYDFKKILDERENQAIEER